MTIKIHDAIAPENIDASRFHAILGVLTTHTGEYLDSDLVEQIARDIHSMVNDSGWSWCFGGSPSELRDLHAAMRSISVVLQGEEP